MTDPSPDATAPLVLVVDDELTIRELLYEILTASGFRVLTASDGDEVVKLAQEHQPAAVLLDLMMPKMDGYTVMARLRSHPMTARMPVIVITGQTDPLYHTLSDAAGAAAHVTKPFSAAKLTETIRRVIGQEP